MARYRHHPAATAQLLPPVPDPQVQRQYTGTAGRVENSQVGVFLAYVSPTGRAMIDRRLYLPETSWCDRPDRLAAAGVPEEVGFATKPALARQMIAAALNAGAPAAFVTGDEVYGADPGLRDDSNSAESATSWPSAATDACTSTTAAPSCASTTSPSGSPPASGSCTVAGREPKR